MAAKEAAADVAEKTRKAKGTPGRINTNNLELPKNMTPKATKRARCKPLRRFSLQRLEPAVPKEEKKLPLKEKGKSLADIPNVLANIDRHTSRDEVVVAVHRLLFGVAGRSHTTKKNLREFRGFAFDPEMREKFARRVETRTLTVLRQVCAFFCLDKSGTREELAERIAKFCEKPHVTDIEPEAKKRARSPSPAKKSKSESDEDEGPKKKRSKPAAKAKGKGKGKKDHVKRPQSSYMFFAKDRRPDVLKKNPGMKVPEVAKELGKMWHKLADKEKAKYEAQAKKDKARYEAEK